MFFETCKKKSGKREERKAGTCEKVGCKGLKGSNASEEGLSDSGSGRSMKGVI